MRREVPVPELNVGLLMNASALLVAGVSLGALLAVFHRNLCDGFVAFVLLSVAFSLALVWLSAETFRAFSPWLTSRLWAARILSVLLGLGLHFTVGAIGWAIWPDLPGFGSSGARWAWIPLWIMGVFFKVGYVSLCE